MVPVFSTGYVDVYEVVCQASQNSETTTVVYLAVMFSYHDDEHDFSQNDLVGTDVLCAVNAIKYSNGKRVILSIIAHEGTATNLRRREIVKDVVLGLQDFLGPLEIECYDKDLEAISDQLAPFDHA